MAERGRLVRLRRGGAVLDASALLAWLVQERGAEVVGDYLPRAVISSVNLSAVLCRGQGPGLSPRSGGTR
jgi:PIN domain nuclease of toxin-antitoxin system